ncbi:hypothetical protein FMN63_18380 [Stappia sp. BW2]|nr:hypothetical protein FMN63_18380 [Stappia sp. BW2]
MLVGALVSVSEGPRAVFVGNRNRVTLTGTGEGQSFAGPDTSGAGFVAPSFVAQACRRLSGVSLEQMK